MTYKTWTSLGKLAGSPLEMPFVAFGRCSYPFSQSDLALLTEAEVSRGLKLTGSNQLTYFASHVALWQLLALMTGTFPEKPQITVSQEGKPMLQSHGLHFNMSRTDQSFLIGLAPVEIGVDVEETHVENMDLVMEHAFSHSEQGYCRQTDDPKAFTKVWTLKEAYVKALGTGLPDNLKNLNVIGPGNVIEQSGLHSVSIQCPNQSVGSVVSRQGLENLICYSLA